MRMLFGVMLVIASTAGGYWLSLRKKRRSLFFSDFRNFHREMVGAATFTKRSVLQVIAGMPAEREFGGVLRRYRESLAARASFEPEIDELTDEEKSVVRNYFGQIGKGDGETQGKFLEYYTQKIDELCDRSEKERERYSKLYIKLGFLIGLILLILII